MPTAYDHQEQSDKDKQPNTLARSTTDWRSARHQSQVAPGSYLNWKRLPPFCAEALGFRTVTYRIVSSVLAALFATVAGALLALWLGYTGPDTTLSFEIMLDILLIVVIGGMGTLYGAVIGSVLFLLSVCYFPTGVVGRLRARVKIR
jgi:hypothetical protein